MRLPPATLRRVALGVALFGAGLAVLAPPARALRKMPVEFRFKTTQRYQMVFVAGSFNNWNAQADSMSFDPATSSWVVRLQLLTGEYHYKFVADGALYVADPGSGQSFSNSNGNQSPQVIRIARQDTATGAPPPLVSALELAPPAPNPARERVDFRIALPEAARVSLALYDLSGRRVRVLFGGDLPAGPRASPGTARTAGAGPRPPGSTSRGSRRAAASSPGVWRG